ncbi:MAG: isopeptide-forming domain-containing fimbrial protein, partial [Chloroflexota bacterium]
SDSTTVTVAAAPGLAIDKTFSGNTGFALSNGQAMANVGDTLTYTLSYLLVDATATNGVITDVLPAGLGYVDGSATNGGDFTFQGYDSATRTLTWTADVVEASGSVTYKITVLAGSFDLPQPLTNTATIDSDETAPSSATADVGVQVVLAETDNPPTTLPPTDALNSDAGSSTPGFGLMLALLVLAGIGMVTGQRASSPRRLRREEIRRR